MEWSDIIVENNRIWVQRPGTTEVGMTGTLRSFALECAFLFEYLHVAMKRTKKQRPAEELQSQTWQTD